MLLQRRLFVPVVVPIDGVGLDAGSATAAAAVVQSGRPLWLRANTQTSSVLYKPFAFDRISNLQITDKPFELPADFNAGDIFRNSFGILIGDAEKPQPIVIRAFGDQRKYIRDLPLHHSQEVLAEGDDYTDYRYFILPSFDFKAELLSKGNRIEVISPQSLREEIKKSHLQAARLYEK